MLNQLWKKRKSFSKFLICSVQKLVCCVNDLVAIFKKALPSENRWEFRPVYTGKKKEILATGIELFDYEKKALVLAFASWPCNCILLLFNFLCRAYSDSLLRAIISRNHLLLFKIFSNFVHFCPNFQMFCSFFISRNIEFRCRVYSTYPSKRYIYHKSYAVFHREVLII